MMAMTLDVDGTMYVVTIVDGHALLTRHDNESGTCRSEIFTDGPQLARTFDNLRAIFDGVLGNGDGREKGGTA